MSGADAAVWGSQWGDQTLATPIALSDNKDNKY